MPQVEEAPTLAGARKLREVIVEGFGGDDDARAAVDVKFVYKPVLA